MRLLTLLFALFVTACVEKDSPPPDGHDTAPPDGHDTAPPGETDDRSGLADSDPPRESDADSAPPDETGGDTGEPPPAPLTPEDFSPIGRAALDALQDFPGSRYVTWNYSADALFEPGWVLQTPELYHWGAPGEDFAVDTSCWDAGCDPDFGLRLCEVEADCGGVGRCLPVIASVRAPGEDPASMCVGHGDALYESMYETLVQATDYADVVSLSEPDGRFEAALRNAITYLDAAGATARIRVLFGSIILVPMDTSAILAGLTRDLDAHTGLQVHVGAWRAGVDSWNHAKIVAADGRVLVQGGHNLWTDHYLTTSPVHDISMRITGAPAGDAQRFADRMWEYTCEDHWWDGWTERVAFPAEAPLCPPPYAVDPPEPMTGGPRVIAAARLGGLGENPSDPALLAAMGAAEHTLRFSLQDIGPIRITDHWSLSDWPDDFMRELAYAMNREVTIYVALSAPGSVPGGLSSLTANYGNGWTASEVAQAFERWFEDNPGVLPDGVTARELLCDAFHVAPLRYSEDATWPGGANIGNHAKLFIADDVAFYMGSQNLYPANLAEFGLLVDDEDVTAELLSDYWDPMWSWSLPAAVSGRDAPECSF